MRSSGSSARTHRTRPGVKVFPRLPEADLQDLYRRAWVFCLPSTYEGFGIPYIEAMASGTPVVATRNAGALEGHRERSLRRSRRGRSSWRETLLGLLRAPSDREHLAADALRHVQKFSLASVAESYESLYLSLVERSRGAARSGP